MENQLFRQKSIDRISSPEELHDYMRVTSPKLWMILGAIIVLLAGFVVYASTARMESTVPVRVVVENFDTYEDDGDVPNGRSTFCYGYLPLSMKDTVSTDMVVRIGDERGKISLMTLSAEDENAESYIAVIITLNNPNHALPTGEYDATIVLESTTPISFLWN